MAVKLTWSEIGIILFLLFIVIGVAHGNVTINHQTGETKSCSTSTPCPPSRP